MPIKVVAHLISKRDTIDQTREILLGLIEPTRVENGCIAYELFQNNSDPTDFTFVEEWTDDAALDAHLESPHLIDAKTKLGDLLAADPDIRRYTLLA
jgi:quinol monooxygenase YgiN